MLVDAGLTCGLKGPCDEAEVEEAVPVTGLLDGGGNGTEAARAKIAAADVSVVDPAGPIGVAVVEDDEGSGGGGA